jgi:Cu(I)/Ag(I) efflux system membrane fusion protein
MPNPDLELKPDMFVNAVIKVPLGSAIVVPVNAVMDTGKRRVVWVETSAGMFEPREVQVGQQTDDTIQVLSGLNPDDKVAVSGGYLIDSESQLKGGGGQDHSQHTGGKPATPQERSPAPEDRPAQEILKERSVPPTPQQQPQQGGHTGH